MDLDTGYLIQHSAGSGKTNSIAWLSHRLASLHSEADDKVFNCVIVITDRRVLDKQLQDAIYQIEHKQGVVQPIDQDSGQLANTLVDGTQIIITTLQKFPFVMERLAKETDDDDSEMLKEWAAKIGSRRYAVIIDEAHSSQTGESANRMQQVLSVSQDSAKRAAEEGDGYSADQDGEDAINALIEGRGRKPNLSFFAFTATPKGKTLQLFGREDSEGVFWPCHLYSMRQAIEEGFILDVLKNYDLQIVLQAGQDHHRRPRRAAKEGGDGVGPIHAPASQQHQAKDGHYGRALPQCGGASTGRQGQSNGGDG